MRAAPAIATIGTGFGVELGTHEMLAAGASVAAAAEYFDLVNKIRFLRHCAI